MHRRHVRRLHSLTQNNSSCVCCALIDQNRPPCVDSGHLPVGRPLSHLPRDPPLVSSRPAQSTRLRFVRLCDIWENANVNTEDTVDVAVPSNDSLVPSDSRDVYFLRATAYMLSAHMLSQFRLSVCLSVTRMDHSKTVEVRIMQFSPCSSPIPLVFAR